MLARDIVVIGASAGGVETSVALVSRLPADLPAAVFIVVHIAPSATSVLPQILSRESSLPAHHGMDGEPIRHGVIYVAPPDQHLLIEGGCVRLGTGPRENGSRPAVDALFRSAAAHCGARTVGIVLSGNLDDGSLGMRAIKRAGGIAIVQDPEEAFFPSMPQNAILYNEIDYVLGVDEMPDVIVKLSRTRMTEDRLMHRDRESGRPPAPYADIRTGRDAPRGDEPVTTASSADERAGLPASGFTCPECHGALWEVVDGALVRYRCRVGHTYSPSALLGEHGRSLDAALWTALTALEEHKALQRRMIARSERSGNFLSAARLADRVRDLDARAALIRQVLALGPLAPDLVESGDDSVVGRESSA